MWRSCQSQKVQPQYKVCSLNHNNTITTIIPELSSGMNSVSSKNSTLAQSSCCSLICNTGVIKHFARLVWRLLGWYIGSTLKKKHCISASGDDSLSGKENMDPVFIECVVYSSIHSHHTTCGYYLVLLGIIQPKKYWPQKIRCELCLLIFGKSWFSVAAT